MVFILGVLAIFSSYLVFLGVSHVTHACKLSHFSRVWLFGALCTVTCQVPLSMGFSRQEYWSELSYPLQGIFPTQGLNPHLLYYRKTLYEQPTEPSAKSSPMLLNIWFSPANLSNINLILRPVWRTQKGEEKNLPLTVPCSSCIG